MLDHDNDIGFLAVGCFAVIQLAIFCGSVLLAALIVKIVFGL